MLHRLLYYAQLFNDKIPFDDLQEISPQTVKIAEGTSQIIEKGNVTLTHSVNITMESYFAPYFNSNLTASHIVSNLFYVHNTASHRKEKACLLFKKGSLDFNDVIWETKCQSRLYTVQPKCFTKTGLITSTNSKENEYKHWHRVVTHISSGRY